MLQKEHYIAPQLTVVSFEVEHGFTISDTNSTVRFHQDLTQATANQSYNSQCQENWHQYDNGNNLFDW